MDVRVLIADDSEAYRTAVAELADATPGFTAVAEVASGERGSSSRACWIPISR
jgi:DNA-binding NarL/FixJ family response regulator